MKARIVHLWSLVSLVTLLSGVIPVRAAQDADFENNPEVMAQWNLNVGSLALDEYQYLDALAYFEDAFETSKMQKTQVRALLYKATTFATFMRSPDSALKIYQYIQKKFPDFAETAYYKEALLLFEEERYPEVVAKVQAYAKIYPQGRFQFQSELLMEQSESVMQTAAFQKEEALRKKVRLQAEAREREDAQRKARLKAMAEEAARLQAEAKAEAEEAARLQAAAKAEEVARMRAKAQLAAQAKAEGAARQAERLKKETAAREAASRQEKDAQRKARLKAMAEDAARLQAEAEAEEVARLQAEAEAEEAARMRAKAQLEAAAALQAKAEETARQAERLKKETVAREAANRKESQAEDARLQALASRNLVTVEEPIVRVLLSKSSSDVLLQGHGLVFGAGGQPLRPGDEVRLRVQDGEIVQKGGQGTSFGKRVQITSDRPIEVTYAPKKKHKVRGFLLLSVYKGGIRVINHVRMEAYLRGVVPAESPASWLLDTLKSQTLAARTYAYNYVLSHAKKSFDLYATHRSQVYGGVDRERKKTDQAVSETRGEIITAIIKGEVQPILAMYASNSGGHTADPKQEYDPHWDPPPYLVAQPDPWSLKAGRRGLATWDYTHTLREVEKNLARRRVDVPNLSAITPVFIGPSGRVVSVRLTYGGGKTRVIRFRPKVTLGLGLPRLGTLPDTIVTITPKGNKLVFDGKGFGHGIGYMQAGGQYMAKAGHSYREILGFYYPTTRITRFWK